MSAAADGGAAAPAFECPSCGEAFRDRDLAGRHADACVNATALLEMFDERLGGSRANALVLLARHGGRLQSAIDAALDGRFDEAAATQPSPPSDPEARRWFDLARAAHEQGGRIALPDGRKLTTAECLAQCLTHDPTDAKAWYNLGFTVKSGELIDVAGRSFNKTACYVQALTHDPTDAQSWSNLGSALKSGVSVVISGRSFTKIACYVQALTHDPTYAPAWYNLGSTLKPDESVVLAGRSVDEFACFIQALKHNPRYPPALFNLFIGWPKDRESVALADGTQLARDDCLARGMESQFPGVVLPPFAPFVMDRHALRFSGAELGRGANGIVFVATLGDVEVAAKMPFALWEKGGIYGLEGARYMARMVDHELELARRVPPHCNVAGPVGVVRGACRRAEGVVEDAPLYVLMQRCGADVQKRLRPDAPALTMADAAHLLCQAACGLAHLHRHGVVHGDFKPANLVVSGQRVLVCDFGEAHAAQRVLAAGPVPLPAAVAGDADAFTTRNHFGSPFYHAHELLVADGGRRPIAAASDVWALGVTMLDVLDKVLGTNASFVVSAGRHQQAVVDAALDELEKCVPARLRKALRGALCVEMSKRATAAVISVELVAWLIEVS